MHNFDLNELVDEIADSQDLEVITEEEGERLLAQIRERRQQKLEHDMRVLEAAAYLKANGVKVPS